MSEDLQAKTIRQWRTAKGHTQETLSRALGVSDATFSTWELGLAEPRATQYRRLSEVLGVPMEAIIIEESPKTERQIERARVAEDAGAFRRAFRRFLSDRWKPEHPLSPIRPRSADAIPGGRADSEPWFVFQLGVRHRRLDWYLAPIDPETTAPPHRHVSVGLLLSGPALDDYDMLWSCHEQLERDLGWPLEWRKEIDTFGQRRISQRLDADPFASDEDMERVLQWICEQLDRSYAVFGSIFKERQAALRS